MVVTPQDLVSALIFLCFVEGFRRVQADEVVIARAQRRWRIGSSIESVWLSSIQWLWLLPWQTDVRTFVCNRNVRGYQSCVRDAIGSVEKAIDACRVRTRAVAVFVRLQSVTVFIALPIAVFLAPVGALYSALAVVVLWGAFIAAAAYPACGWTALKYGFYPPAGLFAVVDLTFRDLAKCPFDVVVAALLPTPELTKVLRKYCREVRFGPDRCLEYADVVEARVNQVIGLRLLDRTAVFGPPKAASPAAVSYCPSCEIEFAVQEGTCADCGDVALVPFTPGVLAQR